MARAAPQSRPYDRSASSSSGSSSRNPRQPSSSSAQAGPENLPASDGGTQQHHHNQRRQSGGSSSRAASRALSDCKKFPSDGSDAGSASAASSPSGVDGGERSPRVPGSVPALLYLLAIPLTLIHLVLHLLRRLLQLGPPPQASGGGRSGGVGPGRASDVGGDGNGPSGDDGGDPDDLLRSILAERGLDAPGSGGGGGGEASDYLSLPASPAITTLLDDALYRAYCAELVPTASAASRLLAEFLSMKEASALILRECRWAAGVPMSPEGLLVVDHDEEDEETEVALGSEGNGIFLGGGVVVDTEGKPFRPRGGGLSALAVAEPPENRVEQLHAEEIARWNEFDTIQDFAQQCYLCANEAIQRLTTDRLAESANVTLQDSISSTGKEGEEAAGGGAGQREHDDDGAPRLHSPQSPASAAPAPPVLLTPADSGIGRCYAAQPRRGCFESPRLYCPDYTWADDAIGGCQRLLKSLSRHRFVALVATHGWERFDGSAPSVGAGRRKSGGRDDDDDEDAAEVRVIRAPTYASATPHPFPSLEAAHALRHLLSDLLSSAVPARLNQFRAAAEANAVVSKRLYLVKCEYRAPARALWESYANLDAAPSAELVERYLREYHGVKVGGGGGADNAGEGGGCKGAGSLRRKGSTGENKKSAAQQQREKLEKIITEKYWKHPAFVEALQLEQCCERMEVDMSQMLLPLSELACEIMNGWKGRLRAVAVVRTVATPGSSDEEENKDEGSSESDDSSEEGDDAQHDEVCVVFGWREVPFMRELLRRLKSILRRKPDLDESTGIRPLLLDLQGVPRHVQDNQDAIDSSTEIPFHPPVNSSLSGWSVSKRLAKEEWFYLEQFLSQVKKLLELLSLPNMPFLVEERMMGSKGDKGTVNDLVEQCQETWDEEMFRAQFKDWFDMVKRQKELDAGGALSTLAESIREAEIELSVAMAPREQLERVRKRLQALRADKEARYRVLRAVVFGLGLRELNEEVVVETPVEDIMFPKLSEPGVFGDQIILSGGVLPLG